MKVIKHPGVVFPDLGISQIQKSRGAGLRQVQADVDRADEIGLAGYVKITVSRGVQ